MHVHNVIQKTKSWGIY